MTATPVRMRCWKTTLVILIGGIVAAAAVDEAVLIRIQQAIQAGELRSARIEVLNALKSGPADPRLHNFLGVIDAQEQDFHGAETAFQRAIALAPRFTGAYLNLGRLYEQHTGPGVLEKALDVYRGLLQFEPGNVEANYQCAWILNRLGKFEGSLKYLARLSEPAQARAAALALRCG